jgi:hypothetical protein
MDRMGSRKLAGSEEALRREHGRAGTEESSVGRRPYGFEAVEFDRMRPADIGEVLLGFELRLLLIGNATNNLPLTSVSETFNVGSYPAAPLGVR